MMPRLLKLTRLSPAERRTLLEVALLLTVLRVALRLLPFRMVQQSLLRLSAARTDPDGTDPHYRHRVVWAARVMARRLLGDKPCLTQALAVQLLLRRRGYPAELCFGVARDPSGALLAHAWIESEGEVVIGGAASPRRYALLLPETGAS